MSLIPRHALALLGLLAGLASAAPSVTLTNPLSSLNLAAPATLTLTASVTSPDAPVAQVDFYQGTTLIGTATSPPYGIPWTAIPAGTYSVTAKVTDLRGQTATSSPKPVIVTANAPLAVTLTHPAGNTVFTPPAALTLAADAVSANGPIAKVDFYRNGTLIGTATGAPYSVAWPNVGSGVYVLTARATDATGASAPSAPVPVTVNAPPTVALASPAPGQAFTAPASIPLSAAASDPDGSLASVDYYQGGTWIGRATQAPYTVAWSDVPAGTYAVTAVATDTRGGTGTSAPLAVTVGAPAAAVYYLHTDPQETPRLVTDAQGTVVWRHGPLGEPFGAFPPEADPDGDGVPFVLNLRFPGQYFDQETNLHYNYYRDYDPQTGRYRQSDPIGLAGGLNTYAYVGGDPVSLTDPLGLKTFMCKKPLHSLPRSWDSGGRSVADVPGNPLYHQYLCISDGKGGYTCGGQDQRGKKWYDPINGPGKPSNDSFDKDTCEQKEPDNNCIEQCLAKKFAGPRPRYGIPFGTDCQEWSDDALEDCQKQCKKK